ncbi:MAG: glutamate--tRNA ligase [Gammaproteobacteria bacterium]|nr:glutamate--tRNA ligase [Gammaproteobacteria bacterium]MBI5618772.1 glutamate--tRNA ligase [Gammaproteobacteria bacterium]
MTIVTRFPPSPTGYLHIGGARTALFNWLYARRHGGRFVFRIEDTDRERSTQAAVDAIFEGMAWLGLDYDDGPYFQTRRFARYDVAIQQLLDTGKAYYCYCSKERLEALRADQMARKVKPRYDGHCLHREGPAPAGVSPVVRLRTPTEGQVVVADEVHGEVSFENGELDDLIIARSDRSPTYHLTVVVDDIDMGITHVIRGDDHLNNTPRQIHILESLGATRPVYAHVPMINGPDGKKLSKRHGAVSVLEYRTDGFLPDALLNYLLRLGWSHGDQEIFSREEMIASFDLESINKAAANFNTEKLLWVNQQYLQSTPTAPLVAAARPFLEAAGLSESEGPAFEAVVDAQRTRAKTLVEVADKSRLFYGATPPVDQAAVTKHLVPAVVPILQTLERLLGAVEPWSGPALHAAVEHAAAELGVKMGQVAQPLRVAVTGGTASPSIDVTLELLGRTRCLERLAKAIADIPAT